MAQPTPFHAVNQALQLLLDEQRALLGDRLLGLYLGGSLALGDFNLQRSDIDFVAVTAAPLAPEPLAALGKMHERLWAGGEPWARRLDGSYVPRHQLGRWSAHDPPCPFVERDSFSVTQQGSAAIQRHILYRKGVVVSGPSPRTLIDAVAPDELRRAVRDMMESWWRPLLTDPAWLAWPQQQPFAILTLCRTLYAWEHGDVASKPVAARWCQRELEQPWRELIAWALAWPQAPPANRLAETRALLALTLDRLAGPEPATGPEEPT